MRNVLADLRYALRGLLARPMFVLVAVLSLGLGIGVTTAIYSLYHQVVLRPLPVPSPETLVNLSAPGPKPGNTSNNNAGPREDIFSYPMFRDLERLQTSFEGIAAHRSTKVNIAYAGETRAATAMLVSGAYFPLLKLQPALGRLLGPQDDGALGGSPVAVLGHRYWTDQLGAAPDVIGRTLVTNGQSLTVVGVAPAGFASTTFGAQPQVYVPLTQRWQLEPQRGDDHADRQSYWLYLFARLRPGVTLQQADADLNGIYRNLLRELEVPLHGSIDPATRQQFADKRVALAPGARGQSSAAQNAGAPLAMLLGAAALVLVVACLNIANLMLARGAARAGEIAVRASIGASRMRLVRQLLVEAGLIALGGALASLPLAALALSLLGRLIPVASSGAFDLQLDIVALRSAFGLAFATVALFGLFPALQLARTEPIAALRGDSARSGGSRTAARFRSFLAVSQIAFSMVSLVLAGLFLQSLANLGRVELGMRPERVATFSISPTLNGYSPERSAVLFERLERELAALPGVNDAAASMVPILSDNEWGSNISLKGREDANPDDMSVAYNYVGPEYLDTLGMQRLTGRDFALTDAAGTAKVAIVNREFAERFGLGPDPVGQRMAFGDQDELDIEIVGMVENSKYSDVREATKPQVFAPWRQRSGQGAMNFYVATSLPPESLLPQIRALVAQADPNLPVEGLQTLPQQIDQLLTNDRFVGSLASAFALLSTLLAALGLYGVLSYTLAQRMREIGLRLALGAAPTRLKRMVFGQVGRMTLIGGIVGLMIALALGRVAQALLYGLAGHDPAVLAGAALLLAVVAFGTGWWPARRASRIDPSEALRHE
jgi:putative ABC transport system permease protein